MMIMNMVRYKNKTFLLLLSGCMAGLFFSCSDTWNEHYDSNKESNGKDLYATLQQQPNLSKFTRMIEICGLKEKFSGSETYTVWTPTNETLSDVKLENLSKEDSALVKQIVYNHIARYNHSTAEIEYAAKRVLMLNAKKYLFQRNGENYFFAGKEVLQKNVVCTNGVMHTLNAEIPIEWNVWEFLKKADGISNIRRVICQYDTVFFDRARSQKIGIDEHGNTVYDSLLTVRNLLCESSWGWLYDEDSIYTCVFPSDAAFQQLHLDYKPYFKSNGGYKGLGKPEELSNAMIDQAIIKHLIFRGNYANLIQQDSITSTHGCVFHDPAAVFNASPQQFSNGSVLITDQLNMKIRDTYYVPFVREVEELSYTLTNSVKDLQFLPGMLYGGGEMRRLFPQKDTKVEGVSNGFIKLVSTGTGATNAYLAVFFGPQVVSAKYDVYCTIVPACAEDSLLTQPTILDFGWMYTRGITTMTSTSPISLRKGFVTNATEVEEVLVKEGLDVLTYDGAPALVITINVPTAQRDQYERIVRIDNIRLVPARQ